MCIGHDYGVNEIDYV